MRELTYYVATSLDGRIADADGAIDAFPMAGDHMDWIFSEYADTLPGAALRALGLTADGSHFDTVLMGWDTYAIAYDQGEPHPYPHLREYVFSRRRSAADVPGDVVLSGDPVNAVRDLKAEAGGSGIWLCGGGQLASALVDDIDRLVLKVNPIALGDGIPLFAGAFDARAFTLAASTRFASGVLVNEYARA